MYPLNVAQQQANVLGTMASGSQQLLTKPDQPSTLGNVLGVAGAAAGLLQGVGSFYRDGGVVYRGGGLADLEPQYYDRYER
jgi:hypothetical protein